MAKTTPVIVHRTATVVDIYCRVSTDPQEENTSLDEQEAAGREYCRQNGLVVGMVHREVFSGFQDRPYQRCKGGENAGIERPQDALWLPVGRP